MKKITYFVLITISFLILICIIYVILGFTGNLYTKKESYLSSNKEYKIVIKGNGAKWPFGSEDIKVYAYKNSFTGTFSKAIYKTKIFNDGKILNDSNFNIEWNDNIAYLSLNGEEQKDEILKIVFEDKVTIENME